MKRMQIEENVSPNLVPMIDIMFLLLLFFMLTADMGQRELEDVKLPVADSVHDDGKDTKDSRLTINVHHATRDVCAAYLGGHPCHVEGHWRLRIKGDDYDTLPALLRCIRREAAAAPGADSKSGRISERLVMIRSDKNAPSGLAQLAMRACAQAGIYRIEVGAAPVKS